MDSHPHYASRVFDSFSTKILVAISIIVTLIVFYLVGSAIVNDDTRNGFNTPEGCEWIDMNPGKPLDPHLACVEGYGHAE